MPRNGLPRPANASRIACDGSNVSVGHIDRIWTGVQPPQPPTRVRTVSLPAHKCLRSCPEAGHTARRAWRRGSSGAGPAPRATRYRCVAPMLYGHSKKRTAGGSSTTGGQIVLRYIHVLLHNLLRAFIRVRGWVQPWGGRRPPPRLKFACILSSWTPSVAIWAQGSSRPRLGGTCFSRPPGAHGSVRGARRR